MTDQEDGPRRVSAAFAKLLVHDVERAEKFYVALGFQAAGRDAAQVRMRLDGEADLYLVRTPPGVDLQGRRGVGVLVCFRCTDVDQVAARAREAGAVVDGPRAQPWHTREVIVTDLDGYRLDFVAPA